MNAEEARELVENFADEFPDAYRLAQALSLAVSVEPELVRIARLELFPDVDAGAEADLWFGPLARSQTLTAMEFVPEVVEPLRQELARDQELLRGMWELLSEFRASTPLALRLEEELTWLALSGERNEEIIENRLKAVFAALRDGQRIGLARWASRALTTLPDKVRETEAARRLSVVAGVQTGVGPVLSALPSHGVAADWLRKFTARDIGRAKVGIRLLKKESKVDALLAESGGTLLTESGDKILIDELPMLVEFSQPPAPESEIIEVPDTYRLLLEVSWQSGDERRLRQLSLLRDETRLAEVGYDEVIVRTILGDTFTLSPRFDYDFVLLYEPRNERWARNLVNRLEQQDWRGKPLRVAALLFTADTLAFRPNLEKLAQTLSLSRKVGFTPFNFPALKEIEFYSALSEIEFARPEPRGVRDWLIPIKVGRATPPDLAASSPTVDFGPKARFRDGFRALWMAITGEDISLPERWPDIGGEQFDRPAELFISYSHKDEKLRDLLMTHLEPIRREGLILNWHDRVINVGKEWGGQIDEHLISADIILLLVSPSFLASDYGYDIEVMRAMERHEAGEARVIPVILRPCDWREAPFGALQALPTNGSPITRWKNRDAAFIEVAKGIRRAVEDWMKTDRARRSSPVEAPGVSIQSRHLPRPPVVGFVMRRDRQGRDIVGRLKEELAPAKNQLVALWGPGGVGKTTLAAETARGAASAYGGRVVWVSSMGRVDFGLTTLLDDIATQLGREDLRTLAPELKTAQVGALVSAHPTLVVLDNFETISMVEQTLCLDFLAQKAACPVLITTRSRIARDDVYNVPLDAMLMDEARDFVQRLLEQMSRPSSFGSLDLDDLIRRCEANPLVLQWVVRQIDLAINPQNVLDALSQGEGDAAERVFTRSFNLPQLGEDGRTALLALSLFMPSASRAAFAEVAGFGDDLNRLNRSVESLASLWLVETAEGNERLFLRGLTRELARSHLSKDKSASELHERFIEYFLRYADLHRRNTAEDLDALEAEKDNLLGAIDLAFQLGNWISVTGIRGALNHFLNLRGYWDEAIRSGEQAVAASREQKNDWEIASSITSVATIRSYRGEYKEAVRAYQEALTIFRALQSEDNVAICLEHLGVIAQAQSDFEEARRYFNESLEINKRLGEQRGVARALYRLGRLAHIERAEEEARQLYNESLEISKTLGDQSAVAATLHGLGRLAQESAKTEEARRLYSESLEISRRLGDQFRIASNLQDLGNLYSAQGGIRDAQQLIGESLTIYNRLGSQQGIASALHQLGLLAAQEGDMIEAVRLARESLSIYERIESPSAEKVRKTLAEFEAASS